MLLPHHLPGFLVIIWHNPNSFVDLLLLKKIPITISRVPALLVTEAFSGDMDVARVGLSPLERRSFHPIRASLISRNGGADVPETEEFAVEGSDEEEPRRR